MENTGFKIISLQAENFKKLKAVNITPTGSTVLLTGKNGAGKSSVLDAIMAALCGKKYCPEKAVRHGEERAKVVVDMGKFKAIRTFNADGGGTLRVESADGFQASTPQKLLDTIVGDIAFDPMDFIRMGSTAAGRKEQRVILMKMAGLDFSDLDARIAEIKSERSVVNAEKNRIAALLKDTVIDEGLPSEEISIGDLTDKVNAALDHNAKIQSAKTEYVQLNGNVVRQQDHIDSIDERIRHLRQQIAEYEQLKEKEVVKLEQLIEQRDAVAVDDQPIDIAPIRAEIAAAEAKNAQIRRNREAAKLNKALKDATAMFARLGNEMKAAENEKAERLSNADFPVAGLSVDENGVTYDGIPLAQVNTAKQLEIGVAISMRLNPKLKVLRMSGNDLDSESLATISKMVDAEGYQAWIERVDESGKVGIYIEEGEVVSPLTTTKENG